MEPDESRFQEFFTKPALSYGEFKQQCVLGGPKVTSFLKWMLYS